MIYLVCFGISVGFAYLANRTQTRRLCVLFSVLSILIPVLLAGLRDYSIGIDTESYYSLPRYWTGAIKYDSVASYMEYYAATGYGEQLFVLFLGVIAQVTGNFSVFLTLAHAVIITGVYIGAFRQRKYVEPALVLLLFYLFFYNQSLNIMRQYMAMAIVFAVHKDIQEGKWLRYSIAVGVAALVHTSALLAFTFPLVYFALNYRRTDSSKNWIRWAAVLGVALAAIVLFQPAVKLLMQVGLLSSKYEFYFKKDVISPAVLASAFAVMGLCGMLLFGKAMRKKCEHFEFLAINSAVYLILMQFSWFIIYGKRLAGYHALPNLITVALIGSAQTNKTVKWIVHLLIIGAAVVYWLYVYGLRNASQTLPYEMIF